MTETRRSRQEPAPEPKVQEKFQEFRRTLTASLVERHEEVDLSLTAMIAGEHVLMVGPPGTAKSLLADSIVAWLQGSKFSICLNKFSTPEEVFGPISLAALKKDEYRRVTAGKLPTAEVAFVDEVFKASSAILNTMLTVLNERVYHNNGDIEACPLQLAIAASNEWPEGKELGALFDRFLFRKAVRPVASPRGRDRLIFADDFGTLGHQSITADEIGIAMYEAGQLTWPDRCRKLFMDILGHARREGIIPGDRRLRKSRFAVQAYAWLLGEPEVTENALGVLTHTLWTDPAEQPRVLAKIVGETANPAEMKVNSLWAEIDEIGTSVDGQNTEGMMAAIGRLKEITAQLKKLSHPRASDALALAKATHETVVSKAMNI